MSLMTQAIVAETYGLRLSMEQLAKALGIMRRSPQPLRITMGRVETNGSYSSDYRQE